MLVLWCSQPKDKWGWEHLHFHPWLQQGAFWGFGVWVFREGESRFLLLPNLWVWLENKGRLCSRMNICASTGGDFNLLCPPFPWERHDRSSVPGPIRWWRGKQRGEQMPQGPAHWSLSEMQRENGPKSLLSAACVWGGCSEAVVPRVQLLSTIHSQIPTGLQVGWPACCMAVKLEHPHFGRALFPQDSCGRWGQVSQAFLLKMSHITQIITQSCAREGRGEDDWRSLQTGPVPLPLHYGGRAPER